MVGTRRIALGVAVALAIAVPGLASVAHAAARPATSTEHVSRMGHSRTSAWTSQSAASAVPRVAHSLGLSDRLSIWGAEDGHAVVGLVSVDPKSKSALRAALGNDTVVTTEPRFYAETRLTRVAGRVTVVHVAVRKVYGDKSAGPSASSSSTPTRLLDAKPWYGGDRIVRTYTSGTNTIIVQCTVAAEMTTTNGTAAMPTAGHCGATGLLWEQGYYPGSGSVIYQAGPMGVDKVTQWGNNRPDGELLEGDPYSSYVWTLSGTAYNVTGPSFPAVGSKICSDGSFTGYTCAGKVIRHDFCASEDDNGTDVSVCRLDEATATSRIVQSGDSGGPVLAPGSPTGLQGLISAGNAAGTDLLFTDVAGLISGLGATVK